MKILIGCERTGITRDAFAAMGHDAWSCDLVESENPGQHLQTDVLNVLNMGWDLAIFHPPCTYLAWSSKRYWNEPGRVFKRIEALLFFAKLWECGIPRICIENPMGCVDAVICKPSQTIHPYFFGEKQLKRTCLWLKNLPQLRHTKTKTLFEEKTHTDFPDPIYIEKSGKKLYTTAAINGVNGGIKRSKSFRAIAMAMAQQWSNL